MINYANAPNNLGPSLHRYIEGHVRLGGFLNAIVENDLLAACLRADETNRKIIHEIVLWLYNEAPAECWGSPEKVKFWLEIRQHT